MDNVPVDGGGDTGLVFTKVSLGFRAIDTSGATSTTTAAEVDDLEPKGASSIISWCKYSLFLITSFLQRGTHHQTF